MKTLIGIAVLGVLGLMVDQGRAHFARRQLAAPEGAAQTRIAPTPGLLPFGAAMKPPASLRRPEPTDARRPAKIAFAKRR